MRFLQLSLAIALILGSGCISIQTHERMMRQCRAAQAGCDDNKKQLAALSAKNAELEKGLAQKTAEVSDVRTTYDELIQELKDSINQGDVGVKTTADGLLITVGNTVLFHSGQAELQPQGKQILMRVAAILIKVKDHAIHVEGHTDNIPISGSLKARYPTNWDLSAARAASVLEFLQVKGGVDPKLLVMLAYGEFKPVADNATADGRKQNRRVEIALVKKQ